jgi:hypothetical protein
LKFYSRFLWLKWSNALPPPPPRGGGTASVPAWNFADIFPPLLFKVRFFSLPPPLLPFFSFSFPPPSPGSLNKPGEARQSPFQHVLSVRVPMALSFRAPAHVILGSRLGYVSHCINEGTRKAPYMMRCKRMNSMDELHHMDKSNVL